MRRPRADVLYTVAHLQLPTNGQVCAKLLVNDFPTDFDNRGDLRFRCVRGFGADKHRYRSLDDNL